jgi:uncharacterized protein YjbI with pentapeptide repeats
MFDSLTTTSESDFVCDCEELMRSACLAEPFYKEHEGKRYCVLHFPGKEKSAEFVKAMERKLEANDFSFNGVWFPSKITFTNYRISNHANFDGATFTGDAYFVETHFDGGVSFTRAAFHARAYFVADVFRLRASFVDCTFTGDVDFVGVQFSLASFSNTVFNGAVDFLDATFDEKADFDYVVFRDYVRFASDRTRSSFGPSLSFQYSRVDSPERFTFQSVTLRPNWFVNLNARKFDFTNVKWDWRSIDDEIKNLKPRRVFWPHRMLSIACRHLAVNAEENHRYEEASKLRYMAMDARRRESFLGFTPWKLSWWYWLASGYGERVSQAFLMLLGILLLAAVLYNKVGFARWQTRVASESDIAVAKRDDVGGPLPLTRAIAYSVAVMTFQKPEPRPATTAAQTVVLLETILGPVQAALLALAIRRKFMR